MDRLSYRENVFDMIHRITVRKEEKTVCFVCTEVLPPTTLIELHCCGQKVHNPCLYRWIAEKTRSKKLPTCPHCRAFNPRFRTLDELTNKEFLMEVEYVWGKRPFWHGYNPQNKGEGGKAYWGWLEDWAEPNIPPMLCYLGNSRNQVLQRIKMYLSF